MLRTNLKAENYRIVPQVCAECGAIFPVFYWFKEASITAFGSNCEHIPGADFYPAPGNPTFEEWYNEQLYIRRPSIASHG